MKKVFDKKSREYEVVESIPQGYTVCGSNALNDQGYIVLSDNNDTLKALKTNGAKEITNVAVLIGDVKKTKAFVENNFFGKNTYRTNVLTEALVFIDTLVWEEEKVNIVETNKCVVGDKLIEKNSKKVEKNVKKVLTKYTFGCIIIT